MNKLTSIIVAAISLVVVPLSKATADECPPYLVQTVGEHCVDGLHYQPNGPFIVFVFCDRGLGPNIGIINKLNETQSDKFPKCREKFVPHTSNYEWNLTGRFWQEKPWARDISSFAWSPSGRNLFVTTHPSYGDGGIFRLELSDKFFERIALPALEKYTTRCKEVGCYTIIKEIDIHNGTMTVETGFDDLKTPNPITEKINIK